MNIQKLKVGHFGKLKNVEIEFKKGLNVIYGKNEAGKSTLQAFIKAMFYGMGSGKREIRANDRKRYLPWSGETALGELYLLGRDQNNYLIKRSFGEKKKKDDSLVIDPITGAEAHHIDNQKPGNSFFDMGEEAFEKTIFIRQLGCEVTHDKDDEMMKRIANMQQTGDESLSYHKAVDALQKAGKSLTSPRKAGKMDKLKLEEDKLRQELVYSRSLHEEGIEEEIRLNRLLEERDQLLSEITRLEGAKKRVRRTQLLEEYQRLSVYEKKIEEKLNTIETLDKQLKSISEDSISKGEEGLRSWRELKKNMEEAQNYRTFIAAQILEQQDLLTESQGYEELEEDIEKILFEAIQGKQVLEEKQKEKEILTEEKELLEKELRQQVEEMGPLIAFQTITPSLEQEIYDREEGIKELKHKIGNDGRRDHLLLKEEILKTRQRHAIALWSTGILLALAGGGAGWFIQFYYYSLSILGLVFTVVGFLKQKSLRKEMKKLEMEISVLGDMKALHKEVEENARIIQQMYATLGVMNYSEFRTGMSQYTEKKEVVDTLKGKLSEKVKQLDSFFQQQDRDRLEAYRKYIGETLSKCHCQDYEGFKEAYKRYKEILENKKSLEKKLQEKTEEIQQFEQEIEKVRRELEELFMPFGEVWDCPEDLEQRIAEIKVGLKQGKEAARELESLESTFRELLKGRDLVQMAEELKEDIEEPILEEEIQEEDELENALKESTQNLILIEKRIKDLEYGIQSRLQGVRSIAQIEEGLEGIRQQIAYYEEAAMALDIGKEVLEQSFRELQRSFGPRFNQTVGQILEQITLGKYKGVKISEDYQIKIEDPIEDKIKDIHYFSNGTWDQVYFALRLGIIEMIFGKDFSIPVMLDDAFVQYDEERLHAVLAFLYDYAKEHQVILFTCQNREIELLKQYPEVNYIFI